MIRIERPDSVSMYGKNEGSYRVGMKFLGLIRMKDIQVEVVDGSYAIPCGMPVGIYLKSKGVMVIGTGQVTNDTGNENHSVILVFPVIFIRLAGQKDKA